MPRTTAAQKTAEKLGLTTPARRKPASRRIILAKTREELKEEFRELEIASRLRKEVMAEVISELDAESAPEPYDFGPLIRGEAFRPQPAFFPREDGQFLIYPGRDHAFIGETESGKDMLLLCGVLEMLEAEMKKGEEPFRVAWIDYEESDGIDTGSRFLNAGLEPAILSDRSRFRHFTPGSLNEARYALADIAGWGPDLAIHNGVTAAYQLFGWKVKEGDDAAEFRRTLVRPLLDAGSAVISTDHVTMENAQGKGITRYAYGGVMKLNVSDGATYLLVNSRTIMPGAEGASRLYIVKDRPGSVKPECEKAGTDPMIRHAGTLVVKSAGREAGELRISIAAPAGDGEPEQNGSADVPDWLMEKVISDFRAFGSMGCAKTAYKEAYEGKGKKKVPMAIDLARADGFLVPAAGSTSGQKLVWDRDWGSPHVIKIEKQE
jgi:hypothetical protein